MSLASITQLVDDKLRIAALGDLAPEDVRDRAVLQALLQFGLDMPQQLKADAVAMGEVIALPGAWIDGRSTLEALEYPVGLAPMASLPAVVTMGLGDDLRIVLLTDTLANGTPVRVHFTAPHAADGSTVPAVHENAVACWAVAEMCRQAATKAGHDRDATISAASVGTASQSGDLARRAKDWLMQYRTALGLPDPEARSGGEAAGVVVAWGGDGHRRGRFSSLGN